MLSNKTMPLVIINQNDALLIPNCVTFIHLRIILRTNVQIKPKKLKNPKKSMRNKKYTYRNFITNSIQHNTGNLFSCLIKTITFKKISPTQMLPSPIKEKINKLTMIQIRNTNPRIHLTAQCTVLKTDKLPQLLTTTSWISSQPN